MRTAVFIYLSPSVILPASVTDVFLCPPSCRESSPPPSSTFTRACPSFATVWFRSAPPLCTFFTSQHKICDLSHCRLRISPTSQIRTELILQRLCWHNSFIWQQSNATPRPRTPSTGCLSKSYSKGDMTFSAVKSLHINLLRTGSVTLCR